MKKGLSVIILIWCTILSAKVFTDPKDFTDSLIKSTPPVINSDISDDTGVSRPSGAQAKDNNANGMANIRQALSQNYFANIERINVKDMELRDILRGLSYQYNLNLAVDNSISQLVTISLSNISVIDLIEFVCSEYALQAKLIGSVMKISPVPIVDQTPKLNDDMYINVQGDTLSVDIRNRDVVDVVKKLTTLSGKNIVIQSGVMGTITSFFKDIPFESGLNIMMENNGFKVRKKDNVYYVDLGLQPAQSSGKDTSRKALWVSYDKGKITLEIENADLAQVLKELSRQVDTNIITYSEPTGKVSAKCSELSLDEALSYLLKGTDYTYKHENNIYIIGDKKNNSLVTSKLIKLKHIKSEGILDLFPESLKKNSTIQIIKEQNALMVLGTNDMISELQNYLGQIDYPTPQILIEALVVDYNTSNIRDIGVMFGSTNSIPDSLGWSNTGQLDLGINNNGLFTTQLNGAYLNDPLDDIGNWLGVGNLGVLPSDFYVKIQALENQGKANIRSRPQIATLNGHPASISIGTTQYYILKTVTPVNSTSSIVTQESERFEQVEANVKLSIVPWVSASGDVTVEITPEFKTPVGTLSSNVPPTINTRVLDSTVRLKDGETIILGGLISENETSKVSKIPFLGNLPYIGKLFRTSSKSKIKTELMIYITPHVFYGDENEVEKWNSFRNDELDSTGKK
ncbi:MAG TPA: secretin and TonB N-terminal domain-containing protein [Candidatus Cloacimonadota bacterium]|jgi:type IV pilus assembly protein PilQ|nr:secretin and TonB N-terminal domain-containing protein [Candidatus Cloacimonadota bacterium]HPS39295.1 secretin and TonB N-terminal domain-containing protein [Candidatus Cloacimonadota bacterium]